MLSTRRKMQTWMTSPKLELNRSAASVCQSLSQRCDELQITRSTASCGTTLFDLGIATPGSLEAGLELARVCLADLASVTMEGMKADVDSTSVVQVSTEHPVAACMASQYAGWEVKGEKFFAMGSGPMRAAAGREPLFDEIGYREQPDTCVGVLESAKMPPDEVCRDIAQKCGIEPAQLSLLVAPTSSQAGTLQVVARSVETALHKLHELGFDLARVVQGKGSAPLPPVASDDLAAIGVTNDAILYGGDVVLHVIGDDASLKEIGPRVPSLASTDYGEPFAEILAKYNNDFYQVDPLLFSAAQVKFVNVDSGNSFEFGEINRDVLKQSFDGA